VLLIALKMMRLCSKTKLYEALKVPVPKLKIISNSSPFTYEALIKSQ